MVRLHPSALDYGILAIYFVVVLGIGFVARLAIKTDIDFFLSGRSLPAWITGLAFIVDAIVLVLVSLVTKPKPAEELRGLVWGLTRKEERKVNEDPRDKRWWRSPGAPRRRGDRHPRRPQHHLRLMSTEQPQPPSLDERRPVRGLRRGADDHGDRRIT